MWLSLLAFVLLITALISLAYSAYLSFAMVVQVREPTIKPVIGYSALALLCGITGIWITTECI
mgnify:CR=1 FL=1